MQNADDGVAGRAWCSRLWNQSLRGRPSSCWASLVEGAESELSERERKRERERERACESSLRLPSWRHALGGFASDFARSAPPECVKHQRSLSRSSGPGRPSCRFSRMGGLSGITLSCADICCGENGDGRKNPSRREGPGGAERSLNLWKCSPHLACSEQGTCLWAENAALFHRSLRRAGSESAGSHWS